MQVQNIRMNNYQNQTNHYKNKSDNITFGLNLSKGSLVILNKLTNELKATQMDDTLDMLGKLIKRLRELTSISDNKTLTLSEEAEGNILSYKLEENGTITSEGSFNKAQDSLFKNAFVSAINKLFSEKK